MSRTVSSSISRLGRLPWVVSACACALVITMAGSAWALDEPQGGGLAAKAVGLSGLDIETAFRLPSELDGQSASAAGGDLAALGVAAGSGRLDVRGGRWAALTLAQPLVPGTGVGNSLSWGNLVLAAPTDNAALSAAVGRAFHTYLRSNAAALRIDFTETPTVGSVTVHLGGDVAQIYTPRSVNGVPVRGSYVTAVVNHGNLVLVGAESWGDVEVSTSPSITQDAAWATARAHAQPFGISGAWGKVELILVPLATEQGLDQVGGGYAHRLAWVLRPSFAGENGHWEALVDAHSNELISFVDTNHYATERRGLGGVLPVTNDGVVPDGVEQPGWPMPFDNVSTPAGNVTTDSGGNLPAPVDGNISSSLSGPFVRMSDNCGSVSFSSAGDLDFGASGGTDCTTPGFGGAGNTHASRSGFYELNRIKEMARAQLPSNTWLQQQLTANMNINNTCNAFWNGATVNFYRSGGGCANTGEIAGVFDHEWGHGIDDNDANPSIANPSGEGIADIYTALRLNTSCIGRNFLSAVCSGNGDPCLTCTGVRDIDFLARQSGNPHTYSWSNSNCGGSVHCVGGVYSEPVWDLWKRRLQAAPYNMDNNTAQEVVTRLTYIGGGNVGTWFAGGPPFGGCGASGGYLNYLAADDDNGNINDGTPHMAAIFAAFNQNEIACSTPAVVDSGCAGTPASAPSVSTSVGNKTIDLSWGGVSGASSYEIFRTDGVFACDFGKVKIGETAATSFGDTGLQNGHDYSYVVIAKGSSDSCFGPASACATATPVAGPALNYVSHSSDDSAGDNDGIVEPNETIVAAVDVASNPFSFTGISAELSTTTAGISIGDSSASYPDVAPNSSATSEAPHYTYSVGGVACGTEIDFDLAITSNEGTWSDSFTELVGEEILSGEVSHASTDTPIAIPDSPAPPIVSTLNVPAVEDVGELRVTLDITHTYRGDLVVQLESPDGTVVTLHNQSGGSADNIQVTYPDTASPDGPGSLDDFVGEAANGSWLLRVEDQAGADTGTLNSWTLHLKEKSFVCNGTPTCVDLDGDDYGDPASPLCTFPQLDCDDSDAAVNPGAAENCSNGIDDDCDGLIDGLDPNCAACQDGDGDGYGNPGDASCSNGPETDCNDTDPAVNPGATEIPNDGIDNDCDASTPPQSGCNPEPQSAVAAVVGDTQQGVPVPVDVALFLVPAAALIFGLRIRRRRR